MIPSSKQLAIYDAWSSTDNNLLVQAVAGSGKTTVILELIKRSQGTVLYVAFNKSIKEEVENKFVEKGIPSVKATAMTLHALGLSAVKNALYRIKIEGSKNFKLYKTIEDQIKKQTKGLPYEERTRLMYTLFDYLDTSRIFLTDDFDEITKKLLMMDKIPYEHKKLKQFWELFKEAREAEYAKDVNRETVMIDFLDMIYLPARLGLHVPVAPDYLFIDEAQDLNLCQHKIIDNLINQGTIKKWVAVGDSNQSIYGFSGAYPESFQLFKTKPNVVELPLDICYRCPQKVITSANYVYDVMEGFKQEEGEVTEFMNISMKEEISNLKSNFSKPDTIVLCRNKSPLIKLLFSLLKEGVPARLFGDDILSTVMNFIKPYRSMSIETAQEKIERELSALMLKENKTEQEKIKFFVLRENYSNFMLFANNLSTSPYEIVENLVAKIQDLFDSKGNDEHIVKLCTIHKSKGLEASHVIIMNENLIPSKFAKSPSQLLQEKNLIYVARTRAKQSMCFVNFNDL